MISIFFKLCVCVDEILCILIPFEKQRKEKLL